MRKVFLFQPVLLVGGLLSGCALNWGSLRTKDAAADTASDQALDTANDDVLAPDITDTNVTDHPDVQDDTMNDVLSETVVDDVVDVTDVPLDTFDVVDVVDVMDVVDVVDVPVEISTDIIMDTETGDGGNCEGTELKVNEVQADGASGSDEFVEIYNPANCSVSLENWSLRYASSGATMGSTLTVMWTGVAGNSVGPGGFVIVGGAAFVDPMNGSLIGRIRTGTGLGGSGGGVGLYNPANTRIDSMAYTSATMMHPLVEGSPTPSIASRSSASRRPDGQDTNNNATDFVVGTPTPGRAGP